MTDKMKEEILREKIFQAIEKGLNLDKNQIEGGGCMELYFDDIIYIVNQCLRVCEKHFYEQHPLALNREDSERFVKELIKTDEKRHKKELEGKKVREEHEVSEKEWKHVKLLSNNLCDKPDDYPDYVERSRVRELHDKFNADFPSGLCESNSKKDLLYLIESFRKEFPRLEGGKEGRCGLDGG